MAKPKLNRLEKNALRQSSHEAIQQAFRSLQRHFQNNRWVGNNNRYRKNCVKALDKDTQRGGAIKQSHLTQYIAASAPLHCADGWGFLGRAIECHSQGDANVARHLAYYAELRAAVALLAVEGIGIFSRKHFIVDSSGNCRKFSEKTTHNITWLALEHWAGRKPSTDLLAKVIAPGGISLQDWLSRFIGGSTVSPIGSNWLKLWGLDIQRLSYDRDSRNEASYRPTRLNSSPSLSVQVASQFMRSLWSLCEPSGNSRFEILDRHLLRLSLRQSYEAVKGNTVTSSADDFEKEVLKMLNIVAPSGFSEAVWKSFLTWQADPELPTIIAEAEGTVSTEDPHHHIQVMSRAALLLRVATGACAELINEAGFSRRDLEFWWRSAGEDLGIWEPGNSPEDITDLWADVQAVLDEAREWESNNGGSSVSYSKWRQEQMLSISVMGECERIAFWGMGL